MEINRKKSDGMRMLISLGENGVDKWTQGQMEPRWEYRGVTSQERPDSKAST